MEYVRICIQTAQLVAAGMWHSFLMGAGNKKGVNLLVGFGAIGETKQRPH
jgi:hypothetical protein